MRSMDVYVGLLAVVAGFAGVVLRAAGASWLAVVAVALIAGVLLLIMLWQHEHEPRVLLVGDPKGGRLFRMRDAIDQAGFAVRCCPGPEVHECPAMHGGPCPIHDHLGAAVIATGDGYLGAVPPCGEALHIPAAGVARPAEVEATLQRLTGTAGRA